MTVSCRGLAVMGSLCALGVAGYFIDRAQPTRYDTHLPPDTVAFVPLKGDSLIEVTTRCFRVQPKPGLRWYTSNANLGESGDYPAEGRTYPDNRAIVLREPYKDDLALQAHELRHWETGMSGHPSTIFKKVCA